MKTIIYYVLLSPILFSCKSKPQDNGSFIIYKTIQYETTYAPCDVTIVLHANKNNFSYKLTGKDNNSNGYAEIIQEGNEKYIVFKGLKYVEYDENIKGYPDVSGSIKGDTIIIQNYGNSMNNYTKLSGCEEKYIYLVKQ